MRLGARLHLNKSSTASNSSCAMPPSVAASGIVWCGCLRLLARTAFSLVRRRVMTPVFLLHLSVLLCRSLILRAGATSSPSSAHSPSTRKSLSLFFLSCTSPPPSAYMFFEM